MRLALLENSSDEVRRVEALLAAAGYEVLSFREVHELIRFLETDHADLLILDSHVPQKSSLELIMWTRARLGAELPILFLANSSSETEIVQVLNAGADNYMIKPLRERELTTRISVLLNRAYPSDRDRSCLEIGDYMINLRERTITVRGKPVLLTPREFDVAAALFGNFGRVMPRELLIRLVWGRDKANGSRTLDTHIHKVRRKLLLGLEHGVRLRTIYTHGYRLEYWTAG